MTKTGHVKLPNGWNSKSRTVPPIERVVETIQETLEKAEKATQKKGAGEKVSIGWEPTVLEETWEIWRMLNPEVLHENELKKVIKQWKLDDLVIGPVDRYAAEALLIWEERWKAAAIEFTKDMNIVDRSRLRKVWAEIIDIGGRFKFLPHRYLNKAVKHKIGFLKLWPKYKSAGAQKLEEVKWCPMSAYCGHRWKHLFKLAHFNEGYGVVNPKLVVQKVDR